MTLALLWFMLGGALAGFVAGLLGIGGGLIVVPFLAFILPTRGIPDVNVMQVAVGTSLAIVVLTSLSSIIAHHRRGGIQWSVFWRMLPGIVIGAFVAAFAASHLPSNGLKVIFGLFALGMGIVMLFKVHTHAANNQALPGKVRILTDAVVIAGSCNLLGLGGGSLLVPYFNHYQMTLTHAVATAALCGFPIALCGVIGLAWLGNPPALSLPYTMGSIYWPAFWGMSIPSMLTAPWGAYWAHRLNQDQLRQIFAFFLLVVAVQMLLVPFL